MSDEDRFIRLLRSAQRFTAYRERAPSEVAEKLREWNASDELIDQIVSELKANDFLNETRFAQAFFHDKFKFNRWGRQKIHHAISKFGLTSEAISSGDKTISEDDYIQTFRELMVSKWDKTYDSNMFKKKTKVANFLLQRGFETDLIWRELNRFSDES